MDNDEESTVVPISPRPRRKPAARKKTARPPGRPARSPRRRKTGDGGSQEIGPAGQHRGRDPLDHGRRRGRARRDRRSLGPGSDGRPPRRRHRFEGVPADGTRLAKEWKGMDPRKKARILAALLGAAAAASAPLVRKTLQEVVRRRPAVLVTAGLGAGRVSARLAVRRTSSPCSRALSLRGAAGARRRPSGYALAPPTAGGLEALDRALAPARNASAPPRRSARTPTTRTPSSWRTWPGASAAKPRTSR